MTPTHTRVFLFSLLFLLSLSTHTISEAYLYTIKANPHLKQGPGLHYNTIRTLEVNQTLMPQMKKGKWIRVKTLSGQEGYILCDYVSDLWIKIIKNERKLFLYRGSQIVKFYDVAFCPFNPEGDKFRKGDGGTPEGRFYICETIRRPLKQKYGARSLRISYPNIEDARRGLKEGLIDFGAYLKIVKAIKKGKIPPQNTLLGGSIRIHGGGNNTHWTLGCVAMNDEDIINLFRNSGIGTRVEIYKSSTQEKEINDPYNINRKILLGAKSQIDNPALYTSRACGLIPLSYPMGDIPTNQAVCTDIIVRAVRNANLDLQALIHEDATTHPARYRKWIKRPNFHIDHRRTRNLQIYLNFHAFVLDNNFSFSTHHAWKPGDIVTMDTGVKNGTICDHIGIVYDHFDNQGLPLVVNIWNIGQKTGAMDLLGNEYPRVVGHFRMTHIFDYH